MRTPPASYVVALLCVAFGTPLLYWALGPTEYPLNPGLIYGVISFFSGYIFLGITLGILDRLYPGGR